MLGLWWTTFPWYEGYGPDGTPVPKEKGVSAPPRAGEMLGVGGIAASADRRAQTASAPTTSADTSSTDAHQPRQHHSRCPAQMYPLTPASVIASAGQWAATGGVNPEFRDKIKGEVAAQVKGWFSHKKTVTNRSNKNPFLDWLEGFERPGPAPRKLPLHKFYMQHPDYASRRGRKCAEELLAEEDEGTRRELAKELRRGARGGAHEPDAAKREACRMNLAQVVQPFLDGINKLTGLHVTLLHSGRTLDIGGSPGYKFHEWDPEGFKKNVMVHWMKFLAETAEHTATRIAPGSGGARWEVPAPMGMAMEVPVPPGSGNVASAAPEQSLTNIKESDGGHGRKRREHYARRDTLTDGVTHFIARSEALRQSYRPAMSWDPRMQELLESLPTDERRHRLYRLSRLHIEEFNHENNLSEECSAVRRAEACVRQRLRCWGRRNRRHAPARVPWATEHLQGPLRKSSRLTQALQDGGGPVGPDDEATEGDHGRQDEGEQRVGKEGGGEEYQDGENGEKGSPECEEGGGGNGAERKKKAEMRRLKAKGWRKEQAQGEQGELAEVDEGRMHVARGVSCGWFGRLAHDGENLDAAGGSLWIPDLALPSKPGLRPAEVAQWIKYGRSTTRETQVENHEKLLGHPGGNGMLTVLLPLVWWRRGEVKEVASEEWVAAVRDVAWVLKGLLSAANNKKRKAAGETGDETARKLRASYIEVLRNVHGSGTHFKVRPMASYATNASPAGGYPQLFGPSEAQANDAEKPPSKQFHAIPTPDSCRDILQFGPRLVSGYYTIILQHELQYQWVPAFDLDTPELLAAFHTRYPEKPGPEWEHI
ncbi:hypothetical protein B0H14DRAFT_3434497 [Mycena olivaceomarginata]|nr:hypothetical protein B0H14DRAFT_3434497 [Mycena olivaceomarginata]